MLSHEQPGNDPVLENGTAARPPEPNGAAAERMAEMAAPAPAADAVAPAETDWHAEAGRKGARRIHELIQRGQAYEREHGLTPGRQRIRQLIHLGKVYEREHGLRNGRKERRPRLSPKQALKNVLHALARIAKPAVRQELEQLLQQSGL